MLPFHQAPSQGEKAPSRGVEKTDRGGDELPTQTLQAYKTNSSKLPTPWKINMEPTKHPFRNENDLPNLHDCVLC